MLNGVGGLRCQRRGGGEDSLFADRRPDGSMSQAAAVPWGPSEE